MRHSKTARAASLLARHSPDVAYVLGLVCGAAIFVGFGFLDKLIGNLQGNDFSGIWAGARALVDGSNPYDPSSWPATRVRLHTQLLEDPIYGYPAWVAIALMPLGLLDLTEATVLWLVGGLCLSALGVRAVLNSRRVEDPSSRFLLGWALLGSTPGIVAFYSGQWSHLLVAALCGAVLLFEGRRFATAGAVTLSFLAKPHLLLFAGWAFVMRAQVVRTWRFLATAAGGTALSVLVSLVVLPDWWRSWLTFIPGARIGDRPSSTVLVGALNDLFGPAGLVIGAASLLVAVAFAIRLQPTGGAWFPIWIALSVVATPYSWIYDQLLLVVPIALAAGLLRHAAPMRARAVVILGVLLLGPISLLLYQLAPARGNASFNALIPVAILVLLWAAIWSIGAEQEAERRLQPDSSATQNLRS